jgi:D-alanine-D-alanine ligase
MSKAKHIAVLMGGWSNEREVSLVSGKAVSKALHSLGYKVSEIDVGRDLGARLAEVKPDVAFNALHGRFGEDGCVQGLLEIMGIPYTHSGVEASANAMDKPTAKRLFEYVGLPCAPEVIVSRDALAGHDPMPRPYVVKPLNEGSSVGVQIVSEGDNCILKDDTFWAKTSKVLVEKYIPGREIQVAVMGDKALGAIEIRMKRGFYDYEAKYTAGFADHLMPAPMPKADYDKVMAYALAAHQVLGCRGVTRSDFRYDDTRTGGGEGGGRNEIYILEVNTQPGMTPLSLVPEIAAHSGLSFEDIVDWLVKDAGVER